MTKTLPEGVTFEQYNAYMGEVIQQFDEYVQRLTLIMMQHLPSTEMQLAYLMNDWNRIKREVFEEHFGEKP